MSSVLALDVGNSRVGVARASSIARLPEPLTTLVNDDTIFEKIQLLVEEHAAKVVVVGLPRNLSGEDTDQTRIVRQFASKLTGASIVFQDEALTSKKAEAELAKRGGSFAKGDVDALAATYILEDYLLGGGVTE